MSKANPSWPIANYMTAWRTFRRLGNEPTATAHHVMSQPRWPVSEKLKVLDIGCGDGRMLEAFLVAARHPVSKAVLVDPDEQLLAEATAQLRLLDRGTEIVPVNGAADVEGIAEGFSADVGIAVHVVYLMPTWRLCAFLEHWPAGVPLYIVMDAPSSVFTELWREPAPDYASRADAAHKYLSELAQPGVSVNITEFRTTVANPLHLGQPSRDLVLSLLCYCDFPSLSEASQKRAEAVVTAHATNGTISCECRCYEIFKVPTEG